MSGRYDVRDLVDDIVRTANDSCYPFEGENRAPIVESIETQVRAFLAERDKGGSHLSRPGHELVSELLGQLAAMRSALEAAIDEIQAMSDSPNRGYSMRVMNELNAALATDAGRLEAEVLRAAEELCFGGGEIECDPLARLTKAVRAIHGKEGP